MRGLRGLILGLGLALVLGSCGGGGQRPYTLDTAQQVLDSGAFSETLEPLERAVYVPFYGLDGDSLSDGAVYGSTGGTAEELAVLIFVDEAAAKAGVQAVEDHLAYQRESNEDYRPAEMPKLDKAVISRRGNTLLYLVAADYTAAENALG